MQTKKLGLLAMAFSAVAMISAVGCGDDPSTCADGGTSCHANDGGTGSGSCNPLNTAIGTNGGLDVCAYGTFCSSTTSTCEGAPVGSCTEAVKAGAPAWDTNSKQAPVIIGISATVKTVTNSQTECQDTGPAGIIKIKFYAPHLLTTHSDFPDLQSHVRIRGGATATFQNPSFSVIAPPASSPYGELTIGVCGGASNTLGVYIADEDGRTSNVSCVSW